MPRLPFHPHSRRWPGCRSWLFAFLACLLLVLTPALCVSAKKDPHQDMLDVIRDREMQKLQREYKQNRTVEDELYQYEQSGRLNSTDYNRGREYVDKRQDIMPLTNGDRYMSEVFWVGSGMQRSMREELPEWMKSDKYKQYVKADKHLERVGPADGAPTDEVRATWGYKIGARGGVTLTGYEKYDRRTQKWYPAQGNKNLTTGKMEYDYTPLGRGVMMENIRRETILRIGPDKYKELMAHARTRTPDYQIEKFMDKMKSEARVYDRQQNKFVVQARVGKAPAPKEQNVAKVEVLPRTGQSPKDRQKEMEKKAEAQQQREAEAGPAKPGEAAGAGLPVIPDTCVIDVVGWDPARPDNKFHGILWLNGGKVAWAMEGRTPAKVYKEAQITARTCVWVFRGSLKDNVISGASREDCTPITTSWSTSSGPCSRTMKARCTSRDRLTLNLDGSLHGMSDMSIHNQWTVSNEERCGRSSSKSNTYTNRMKGTWRIRRGGGAGGRSWTEKSGSYRLYNPDAVASER